MGQASDGGANRRHASWKAQFSTFHCRGQCISGFRLHRNTKLQDAASSAFIAGCPIRDIAFYSLNIHQYIRSKRLLANSEARDVGTRNNQQ